KIYKNERILVLAPHQDDEIIGPGGTLLKHLESGNLVHVVFITDGRKGKAIGQTVDEIIAIRKLEAIRVCEELGASYTFLNCKDGGYIPECEKISKLTSLLDEIKPT